MATNILKGNQAVLYKSESATPGLLTINLSGGGKSYSYGKNSFNIAVMSVDGSLEENFQLTQDFASNLYYTVFGEKAMQLHVRCIDLHGDCDDAKRVYKLSNFATMLRDAKKRNQLPEVTITYDKFTINGYLVAIQFIIQHPSPAYELVIIGTFS